MVTVVVGCLFLLLIPGFNCKLNDEEIQILTDSGITVIDKDANTWTLEHHGVPDHGFEGGFGNNPNTPSEQNYSFDIPKESMVATEKGCVRLGPIGMSLSGAPFFNPYTREGKNAVEGDCKETFDDCFGHPSGSGAYHYHRLPSCMYKESIADKFLGVAFDGYPIYGQMDRAGRNWTSLDLDQCHGHLYNGRYVYRITLDFPYILGCYHGIVVQRNMPTAQRPPGQRPPAAGGRRKRLSSTQKIQRYKRQIPGSLNPCRQVEDVNWSAQTCYAFCENPGDGSYDDCIPVDDNDDDTDGTEDDSDDDTDGTEDDSAADDGNGGDVDDDNNDGGVGGVADAYDDGVNSSYISSPVITTFSSAFLSYFILV